MLFRLVLGLRSGPLGSRSDLPGSNRVLGVACITEPCNPSWLHALAKTLPVNAEGTWFRSGPMQAKYVCSDPSTDAGLEECLSVLMAPQWLHGQPETCL